MITTDRLFLRDYVPADWERVHLYGADPDFSKYELWGPNSAEETQAFVNDMARQPYSNPRFKFDLAVCLKDGPLIGGCSLRRETALSRAANMGWAINPDFQGKGYATEAARAMIEFGLARWDLSLIYATCDTRNAASAKVMEKLGMKRVGLIRGTEMVKGHLRHSYRYELPAAGA